eukprot:1158164-Pelagomonas_calceolata.AAC.8
MMIAASHGVTQGVSCCCGAEHTEFGSCAHVSFVGATHMSANPLAAEHIPHCYPGKHGAALVWFGCRHLFMLQLSCPRRQLHWDNLNYCIDLHAAAVPSATVCPGLASSQHSVSIV